MNRRRRALLTLPLLAAAPALAQVKEPVLGTPGQDAGWIPTPNGMVEAMLEMAKVTKASPTASNSFTATSSRPTSPRPRW